VIAPQYSALFLNGGILECVILRSRSFSAAEGSAFSETADESRNSLKAELTIA